MNSDEMRGKWNQFKGAVKQKWGKLTDDDIKQIEGNRDVLVGKIQERYGIAREKAEQQLNEWKMSATGSQQDVAKGKSKSSNTNRESPGADPLVFSLPSLFQ